MSNEELRDTIREMILSEVTININTNVKIGFYGEKTQTVVVSLYLGNELISVAEDYIE